ncbi:nucleotidyltransferase domain-containing protein [Chitinophaga rhizosphaerae]|uniref:nucleotidyltransferase domain-containing protein n=1 Tax=Chitinophaga rhizosphaerae TaxID=1864947 RepID=UPI0013DFB5EE|nr:nucleotidyltransferase [Chitinophaga rhizosphaerae]
MARTVDQAFDELIKRIQPLPSEQGKVKSHYSTVNSCLSRSFGCYDLREIGSFGSGTSVRNYSDTDYFAACPSEKISENSNTMLVNFRNALSYTFHSTTGIRVSSPAVRIPFGSRVSELVEVCPARFKGLIQTPLAQRPYYEIPDSNGGWMKASPNAHNHYV